jgi:hypothetical protein
MQREDFVELFEIMAGPAGHHPPARSAAARVPAHGEEEILEVADNMDVDPELLRASACRA